MRKIPAAIGIALCAAVLAGCGSSHPATHTTAATTHTSSRATAPTSSAPADPYAAYVADIQLSNDVPAPRATVTKWRDQLCYANEVTMNKAILQDTIDGIDGSDDSSLGAQLSAMAYGYCPDKYNTVAAAEADANLGN